MYQAGSFICATCEFFFLFGRIRTFIVNSSQWKEFFPHLPYSMTNLICTHFPIFAHGCTFLVCSSIFKNFLRNFACSVLNDLVCKYKKIFSSLARALSPRINSCYSILFSNLKLKSTHIIICRVISTYMGSMYIETPCSIIQVYMFCFVFKDNLLLFRYT